jgi:methylated-DNA-[protein]-cysteine S-methyltransferase
MNDENNSSRISMNFDKPHHGIIIQKAIIVIGKTGSTPLGTIWVAMSENGLIAVEIGTIKTEFTHCLQKRDYNPIERPSTELNQALEQLTNYLNEGLKTFNLNINWEVLKPFQRRVLGETYTIPYGHTMTYAQIADGVGNPLAARAVGRAEATNPMPLVIPCHRVVGSDGKLHGFGAPGGIKTKAWLFKLEGAR